MTTVDTSDRRQRLVEQLRQEGFLTSSHWCEAFRTVPREAFVQTFAVPSRTGASTRFDLDDDIGAALDAIYGNTTLLTQQDAGGTATSSSTTPSLMALMLERLAPEPGDRILEIGTGTGYNAALLSAAPGHHAVTSVDLDPELVAAARTALNGLGYHPLLLAGDGAAGAAAHGPYDRIIVTCGMPRVPGTWVRQVRPGGRILTTLGFALADLTVTSDGRAVGPLTDYAAFMPLRRELGEIAATGRDVLDMANGDGTVYTGELPEFRDARPLECLRALVFPDLRKVEVINDGEPESTIVALADPSDGSWARARPTGDGQASVIHGGPRDVWAEYMRLASTWDIEHGRAEPTRYGLTVTVDGDQWLWLDEPAHPVLELTAGRPID